MNPSQAPDARSPRPPGRATRRRFLERVAASAAGAAALAAAGPHAGAAGAQDPGPAPLPAIRLGPHTVSRLILGGNPVYGHSHFNELYSRHLIDFHTPERVVELLKAATAAGITAWQNSWAPRTVDDV